jgi:hypothetical protein
MVSPASHMPATGLLLCTGLFSIFWFGAISNTRPASRRPRSTGSNSVIERMPVRIHTALAAAVITGGVVLISAASQAGPSGNLAFLEIAFLIFVFSFVLVVAFFLVIRIVDSGQFEYGHGKRFAKQIAFFAHPQAYDGLIVHLCHRNRMASGFQNDDIAWFQFHDLSSARIDADRSIPICHDRPITALHRSGVVAGLEGAAVIATDAVISVATSIIKISVFGLAGVITAQVLAFAVLIGAISIPGAFLAKAFVERMPVRIHAAILDVAVIAGGLMMISAALRSLV